MKKNSVPNFLKKLLFQPRRPYPTTQPIAYQLKKNFISTLWGIKPFSSMMYLIPFLREQQTRLDINERIIENPFVFQHLPKSKKTKILDIGSCETIMPIQLASLGYQVTGMDIRPYDLTHPNLKFIQEDICQTTLPKESFDVITCISVIEHIGLDTLYGKSHKQTSDKKALQQMYKLLKPGGELILTTPVAAEPFEQPRFMRIYSPNQLKKMLNKFTLITEKYYSPSANRAIWNEVSAATLPKPPQFGVVTLVIKKSK